MKINYSLDDEIQELESELSMLLNNTKAALEDLRSRKLHRLATYQPKAGHIQLLIGRIQVLAEQESIWINRKE
jgi:hypothetical protein